MVKDLGAIILLKANVVKYSTTVELKTRVTSAS